MNLVHVMELEEDGITLPLPLGINQERLETFSGCTGILS